MKRVCLLLLFMISFSSAAYDFCYDGEQGDGLEILSVTDALEDNSAEWIWDRGNDVEVEVEVQNNLDEEGSFIAELVFVDGDGDEVYAVTNNGDLEESFALDPEEIDTVSFNFEIDESVRENVYDLYVKFYVAGDEDVECMEEREDVRIGSMIFCEEGKVDDSNLEIVRIRDNNLDNDNDWAWSIGDEIEILVDVSNKNYSDMYFDVELVFVDEGGDEVAFATSAGELAKSVEVEEDETEEITFNFEIDDKMEDGVYGFYVSVISAEDIEICTSVRADGDSNIEIEVGESLGVLVSSVDGPVSVAAGSVENYTVVVKNLGTSTKERIAVFAYNLKLGIKEEYVIYDLGAGSSENVSFSVEFPENASGASERISFFADYDYDEKTDFYLSSSSDGGYSKSYLVVIDGAGVDDEGVGNDSFGSVSNDSEAPNGSGFDGSSVVDPDSFPWVYWVVGIVVILLILIVYLFRGKLFSRSPYPSVKMAKY